MGEFRSIACISDVHISEILAERMTAVLGPAWPSLRLSGDAWAYVDGRRALGVGGIEPVWPGRYVLWSYEAGLDMGDLRGFGSIGHLRIQRCAGSKQRVRSTVHGFVAFCSALALSWRDG